MNLYAMSALTVVKTSRHNLVIIPNNLPSEYMDLMDMVVKFKLNAR